MDNRKLVWMDVDPGHDDATAIMLAVSSPMVDLLGISTTHGNANSYYTAVNAARCLVAFGAPANILVYPGAEQPLLRPVKHDPEIHGEDGLGGVEGLPSANDEQVRSRFSKDEDGNTRSALEGIASALRAVCRSQHPRKVTIVGSGPLTNISLFFAVYHDLALSVIDEVVFMGGAIGIGNRAATAEYNILCDPHAAQMVLNFPVKKTMIPINVTHTAIATSSEQCRLLDRSATYEEGAQLPKASSEVRHTLFTIINFFAETYKSTFGFNEGPPLHDALTIAFVANPEIFACKRYRVDVELQGEHTLGETVVDVWQYKNCDETWGQTGKNCMVAEKLEVTAFWEFFHDCVRRMSPQKG